MSSSSSNSAEHAATTTAGGEWVKTSIRKMDVMDAHGKFDDIFDDDRKLEASYPKKSEYDDDYDEDEDYDEEDYSESEAYESDRYERSDRYKTEAYDDRSGFPKNTKTATRMVSSRSLASYGSSAVATGEHVIPSAYAVHSSRGEGGDASSSGGVRPGESLKAAELRRYEEREAAAARSRRREDDEWEASRDAYYKKGCDEDEDDEFHDHEEGRRIKEQEHYGVRPGESLQEAEIRRYKEDSRGPPPDAAVVASSSSGGGGGPGWVEGVADRWRSWYNGNGGNYGGNDDGYDYASDEERLRSDVARGDTSSDYCDAEEGDDRGLARGGGHHTRSAYDFDDLVTEKMQMYESQRGLGSATSRGRHDEDDERDEEAVDSPPREDDDISDEERRRPPAARRPPRRGTFRPDPLHPDSHMGIHPDEGSVHELRVEHGRHRRRNNPNSRSLTPVRGRPRGGRRRSRERPGGGGGGRRSRERPYGRRSRERRPRPRPGSAVQVRGRAFGALPQWFVRPPPSNEDDDSFLPLDAQVVGDSEGCLVEATAVTDDELSVQPPLVFATAEKTDPSSVRLLLQKRTVRLWLAFGLCFVAGLSALLAGVAFEAWDDAVEDDSDKIVGDSNHNQGLGTDGLFPDVSVDETRPIPTPSPTAPITHAPTVDLSQIITILSEYSEEGSLRTPGTPQHSATFWLANHCKSKVKANDRLFSQRYALLVLYYATNVPPDAKTKNRHGSVTSWMSEADWLNPEKHECDWGPRTISCSHNKALDERVVTGLDLSKNGLEGQLPPEIGLLDGLQELFLNENNLRGTIPEEMFDVQSLKILSMQKNDFTGTVPEAIRRVKDLSILDLSHNNLVGSIPESFYELKKVRTVDLSHNKIGGKLNDKLRNLQYLTFLNLAVNEITGTIPYAMQHLEDLAFLYLDHNRLTGAIPNLAEVLMRREELTASHNDLTGTIPTELPSYTDGSFEESMLDMVRVQKVDMSHNKLSGTVSYLLGFVPTLKYLDISNNQLTGPILPTVYNLKSLEHFILSNNEFVGHIPKAFPPGLKHLELQGNKLSHGIPKQLANLPSLQFIAVGDNNLGGTIPDAIGSMQSLRYFNARNCGLKGTIPTTLGDLNQLDFLNLGVNNLSGSIPSEIGKLRSLINLNLDGNSLTKTIPVSIGNLSNLKLLALHNNLLTGKIPSEFSFLEDLGTLHLDGNDLQGTVPQGLCQLQKSRLTDLQVDCEIQCQCCLFQHCQQSEETVDPN